ncbi:hypothetical protein HBI56_140220 [Parastagonospora nodorum]|uniref:Uncharacterized protein n=1 Tax=Phaeosphaeria nodorum (strain SN15 / ATCC MYA-4574 / FGSC 10173) TaxID=321614 RepID=A0A7U2I9H9_PHANO|nr:hypothetical protein HBH56_127590 [Parastagonospora nodorum]QRD05733.1 hypothetical protein JI435_422730 [Parastagonospora nodorum SN15]KAH3931413.1 hypothetical protein HBH54_095910 [Parastagonospora nodorum]KAH3947161.1 hypothetical protein HBH53_117880 [Parastagonospora nodorum]KAH3970570.1 hypothetical protein HBH51_114300 [Parastagonospora nodorum]
MVDEAANSTSVVAVLRNSKQMLFKCDWLGRVILHGFTGVDRTQLRSFTGRDCAHFPSADNTLSFSEEPLGFPTAKCQLRRKKGVWGWLHTSLFYAK